MSEIKRLANLLQKTLSIIKEDRAICKRQVTRFEDQLTRITGIKDGEITSDCKDDDDGLEMEMSQEGNIEKELNKAVRNLLVSSMRFDAIINAVAKIREAEIKADGKIEATRVLVNSQLPPGGKGKNYIAGPVDFTEMEKDVTAEAEAIESEPAK